MASTKPQILCLLIRPTYLPLPTYHLVHYTPSFRRKGWELPPTPLLLILAQHLFQFASNNNTVAYYYP